MDRFTALVSNMIAHAHTCAGSRAQHAAQRLLRPERQLRVGGLRVPGAGAAVAGVAAVEPGRGAGAGAALAAVPGPRVARLLRVLAGPRHPAPRLHAAGHPAARRQYTGGE